MNEFISSQDVIIKLGKQRGRDTRRIGFSEKFAEYYDPNKTKGSLFKPRKYPMFCSPDEWKKDLSGGGYLIKEDHSFAFNVKSSKQRICIISEYKKNSFDKTFLKALNLLQQTPYNINKKILNTMKHFHGSTSYGNNLTKKLLQDQTLSLADDLADRTFYIPWYLDFRGRMYSSVLQISPQSHDEGRSLLVFSEKKHIDKHNECASLENLAVFGYSKYGSPTGKVSKEKMISWIESNERDIFKSAQDPILNFEFWQKASDRYSFLAFCFEWKNIQQSKAGERYTNIPVYVDGTCNGFQHYAALLRDHISAPFVNLVDGEIPGDFYQNVVDKLHSSAGTTDFSDDITRKFVAEFVDRSFIKKSIISAGYGAGLERRSKVTSKNLHDALVQKYGKNWFQVIGLATENSIEDKDIKLLEKARKIEKQIDDAIKDICPAFSQAKNWLTGVQSLFNENNKCLCWNNPAGVPVHNFYYQFPVYEISLYMDGKLHKIQFRDYESTQEMSLRKKKTSSSISPNYIHSLDAGHAAKIITSFVKSLGKNTPHCIASVHDSFACHTTHVNALQKIIREQFCEMHSKNQLKIFKDQVEQFFDVSLPDLPSFGNLDLNDVLKSRYFFY
ncbi:DNA-directed RNA polymerase [Solidesulfovibrio magneticus]|uniref:DNA-directed RNA polymerase n=1 Tax=Solidesulfovibrio magneticus TaxID=184917 RepID=UPI0011D05412|nr:DNA-directed RNA polymerase [Solidesulfovibrio magneticus]